MRALTLTQPWCGLVAAGIKLVENRSRRMAPPEVLAGEMFALHASKHVDDLIYDRIAELAPDVLKLEHRGSVIVRTVPCKRDWMRLSTITSSVIAVARVEHVIEPLKDAPGWSNALPVDQRRWFFGPVGYVLRDVRAIARPVPCKGMLGFWTVPDDVEASVRAQLQEAA